jgi:hypothetical protein
VVCAAPNHRNLQLASMQLPCRCKLLLGGGPMGAGCFVRRWDDCWSCKGRVGLHSIAYFQGCLQRLGCGGVCCVVRVNALQAS